MKLPVACLLAACLTTSVFSEVIFNNFGPNDSYDASSRASVDWWIDSPGSSGNYGIACAARFEMPKGNYAFSSVTLAMGRVLGTNNLAISIREDDRGLPTGGLLTTLVTHPIGPTGYYQVVTNELSLQPVIVAGGAYWLVLEPADLNLATRENNAAFDWYWSGTVGYGGDREFNYETESWYDWQVRPTDLIPAFRIEGMLVPEPSAWALLLLGATGCFLQIRRRPDRKRRTAL